MADPLKQQQLAQTNLTIPQFGLGGGTLGDPTEITSEAQAETTLATAWQHGVRYFDTAPWYGNTKSEHRLGHFLHQQQRDEFMISTKVGRVYFRPADLQAHQSSPWMARWRGGLPFDLRFDYSHDGIMRSYEDSLTRLGLNRVDALAIHDLDLHHQRTEEGVQNALQALDTGGGYAALKTLKQAGEIKAIGAGINHTGMIPRFVERFDIDYFLIAMPYTLLDQPALDGELQLCQERNISVIIGAVFASGILATGVNEQALYAYKTAPEQICQRVARIETICSERGISLPAAALQFPLAHPAVTTVIPGANTPAQVTQNLAAVQQTIPGAFWQQLKAENLLRADAPTPT